MAGGSGEGARGPGRVSGNESRDFGGLGQAPLRFVSQIARAGAPSASKQLAFALSHIQHTHTSIHKEAPSPLATHRKQQARTKHTLLLSLSFFSFSARNPSGRKESSHGRHPQRRWPHAVQALLRSHRGQSPGPRARVKPQLPCRFQIPIFWRCRAPSRCCDL